MVAQASAEMDKPQLVVVQVQVPQVEADVAVLHLGLLGLLEDEVVREEESVQLWDLVHPRDLEWELRRVQQDLQLCYPGHFVLAAQYGSL